jgi:hypothetical protein
MYTFREPITGEVGVTGSNNLTVSGGGDGTVILQGELTVSEAMSTTGVFSGTGAKKVTSNLRLCDIESTACGMYTIFTEKVLQTPIKAKEGQKVNVTVQISFE